MSANYNEHSRAAEALFHHHALDALCYLIEQGRELEFTYQDQAYFLSTSQSTGYVSLWQGKKEDAYSSMDCFLQTALLQDTPFLVAWADVELQYLL